MAVLGLNLPADILWERVCVTEDMIDPKACDWQTPPKWNSSMALFRYTPEAEYQVHPNRKLIYYKLICTITSYQPQSDEVEGRVDWSRVHPSRSYDFEQKLKSYIPCHGAIVQVTVTPPDGQPPALLADYPYFLDLQPKQRALYELASDTNERSSRSLESLSVSKGAGTARSLEALDVDSGGSSEIGISAGGGGGKVGHSTSGMWGTKRLSRDDQSNVQTSDSGREARDTVSHTTEISQMYNLLQAYHQGTNRAIFYMAPRPHVLEEPSGFIRGPRVLDGIQEFFMIVSQLATQGDPCVSARLDTAHFTYEDQLDFDKDLPPQFLNIDVSVPIPARSSGSLVATSSSTYYDCYEERVPQDASLTAPDGYGVSDWVDTFPPDALNGSVDDPVVTPDRKTITMRGSAAAHACFLNNTGEGANEALSALSGNWFLELITGREYNIYDDVVETRPAWARRRVQVSFISDKPTKVVGKIPVLLITSRGLCCCANAQGVGPPSFGPWLTYTGPLNFQKGIDVAAIPPPPLSAKRPLPPTRHVEIPPPRPADFGDERLTARQANDLQQLIGSELRRVFMSVTSPAGLPRLEREYMMAKLLSLSLTSQRGSWRLGEPVRRAPEMKRVALTPIADMLGKRRADLTRYDVARLGDGVIAAKTGTTAAKALDLRLAALGFPTKPAPRSPRAPKPAAPNPAPKSSETPGVGNPQ